MKVARQLQAEGLCFLSLCQVPSLRAASSTLMESRLVRFGMHTWWNYVPWLYDPPRQYHFKSRFRPAYRECFVAASPGFQLMPFFAFALKWGVIWPDFRRLPRHMLERMRKWRHPEQLADPELEEHQIIDDLGILIAARSNRGGEPEPPVPQASNAPAATRNTHQSAIADPPPLAVSAKEEDGITGNSEPEGGVRVEGSVACVG